jgi:hypothetical protein
MMHPRHWLALGSALALALSPIRSSALTFDTQVQAAATWAENLSRTSHLPTQKSARVFAASATIARSRQLDSDWLLVTGGELSIQHVPRYDGLDRLGGGASLNLRRKFGLGPYVPVLQLEASIHGESARESGRSGWQPAAGLRLSRRFTESWRASGGAGWTHFIAAHEPFDVQSRRLFLETSLDLASRWQVTLGAAREQGEFTANASGAVWSQALGGGQGPAILNHYRTLAWEVSHTFGPGWVAYRIRDSRADQWWLEIAPALTDRTTLAMRYAAVRVINALGIDYDSAFWTLSLAHRF